MKMQQASVFFHHWDKISMFIIYSVLIVLTVTKITSQGVKARKEQNWVELHLREKCLNHLKINFTLKWFIFHPSWATHAGFDTSFTYVVLEEIWIFHVQKLAISWRENVHYGKTVSLRLKLTTANVFWWNSIPLSCKTTLADTKIDFKQKQAGAELCHAQVQLG